MRISIRKKLVLAISLLLVVLFALVAWLFINEKKVELANDIYVNSLAFAKLTAPDVIGDYDLYLAQGGFVYFNREIQNVFAQNDDVSGIMVISYEGEVLYDSSKEVDKRYDGPSRVLNDKTLLQQVQSESISLKTLEKVPRVLYLFENGVFKYVDRNERAVEAIKPGALIERLVVPASEKYSVVYTLDYSNLEERISIMMHRIIYLAIFGVMLGMLLSFFLSKQLTQPVKKLVIGVDKIAQGDFKARVDIKTHDELYFLGNSFNKMAVELEESMEAKLYKERVTRELELATQIQKQIVPEVIPKVSGLDIAAGLIPAEEIGGDMYDFLPIINNKLVMYLGDVTGHGVPAGIVSSIASALFYGYSGVEDLKKVMIDVNRVLSAKTVKTMFMTLCLMEWDSVNMTFKYVSAGHEQLIHYKAKTGTVELTPSGGVALGMLPDVAAHMKVVDVMLEPGDFIVTYSDGIPEAWRTGNEQYGMERFLESVRKAGVSQTSEQMKEIILKDLNSFTAGHKQMDDVTLVVLKRV